MGRDGLSWPHSPYRHGARREGKIVDRKAELAGALFDTFAK